MATWPIRNGRMAYRHAHRASRYWEPYGCDNPNREACYRRPGRWADRGVQGAGGPAGRRANSLHERQDPEPHSPEIRLSFGRVLRGPAPSWLRWYDEGHQRLQVGFGGEVQLLCVLDDRRRDQTPPPRHAARQETPLGAQPARQGFRGYQEAHYRARPATAHRGSGRRG